MVKWILPAANARRTHRRLFLPSFVSYYNIDAQVSRRSAGCSSRAPFVQKCSLNGAQRD